MRSEREVIWLSVFHNSLRNLNLVPVVAVAYLTALVAHDVVGYVFLVLFHLAANLSHFFISLVKVLIETGLRLGDLILIALTVHLLPDNQLVEAV